MVCVAHQYVFHLFANACGFVLVSALICGTLITIYFWFQVPFLCCGVSTSVTSLRNISSCYRLLSSSLGLHEIINVFGLIKKESVTAKIVMPHGS